MTKRRDDSNWWIGVLIAAVGVGFLYYVGTGLGRQNDSVLLPNKLEDQIDLLITRLNERFGAAWLAFGLNAVTSFVRANLPPGLVDLVDVVVAVENESKSRAMTSQQKQELAFRMVRRY